MENNVFEQLNKLDESRKEYDIYFKGPFWIIADSVRDIVRGNFKLETIKTACTYDGTVIDKSFKRRADTHKKIWENSLQNKYNNVPYNYYPRGRVGIYEANGVAYIFLNSQFNNPFVIDAIVKKYGLEKLDIEVELNDVEQGSHYDFLLK